MSQPTLYIFAGLPGSGKTTVSQLLASRVGAATQQAALQWNASRPFLLNWLKSDA